jgi:hypothetical protein
MVAPSTHDLNTPTPTTAGTPGVHKARRTRVHRGVEYVVSEAHPVAELFPWWTEDELDALAAEIAHPQIGLKHRVKKLADGRILDGRNRELAWLIAKQKGPVPYDTVNLADSEIPQLVIALNITRRHLTPGQLAMIAEDLAAKCGMTQAAAAALLKVSRTSLTRANAVRENGTPELADAVRAGTLDVKTAHRLTTLPPAAQVEVATAPDPKGAARAKIDTDPGPSIAELVAPPDWRAAPVAALNLRGAVEDALRRCDVGTVEQLADRLAQGDTFNLPSADVAALADGVDAFRDQHDPDRRPAVSDTPVSPIKAPRGKARPGPFEACRQAQDLALKHLRAARDVLNDVYQLDGGAFLRGVRLHGEPLAEQVRAPAPPGLDRGKVWRVGPLEALIRTVKRTRVNRVCAGCNGGKCRACRYTGFVPEDETLLKAAGGQAGFDFDDVWDQPEGEADEHRDQRDAG